MTVIHRQQESQKWCNLSFDITKVYQASDLVFMSGEAPDKPGSNLTQLVFALEASINNIKLRNAKCRLDPRSFRLD